MSGGLFGTPLALNLKCIVFSVCVLLVYWLPHPRSSMHQFVAAFLLATAAYISLAWYDYLYDCTDKLGPTIFGWFSQFAKPPQYQTAFDSLPVKYKKTVQIIDIVVLSVVVIAFVYPFWVPRR